MKRALATIPLATLPLFALLLGCVPGGIAPQQKVIAGDSLGLGATPGPQIDRTWWTSFGDPALDRIVAEALAGNPGLAEALARLRAAKAGVSEANSALYPHATFNAQEEREHFSDTYIFPPPYAGTDRWFGTIEADLSWNLDFWGKEADQLDKAKALRNAARLDAAAARLAVEGAIVQAYIDLDRAYKLSDIAAQTLADRDKDYTLTARRLHDGLDSKVEEQEAAAVLAEAREAKVRADGARDIVMHEIAALMGRGADVYGEIGRPALRPELALTLPQTLPADLLARRPDIMAAHARIDAATAGRAAAKAAFYPDIDLLASAGFAAIGLSPLFAARSAQYGAGPAVHLPIFDAGQLRAEYTGATADLDGAVADYNGTLATAVRETADALTRIHSLDDEQSAHRRMLDAAENGYRLAGTRYRSGLTSQLTVLNAENVLFDARQGEVSLAADAAEQRVALVVAIGGGFGAGDASPQTLSSRQARPESKP